MDGEHIDAVVPTVAHAAVGAAADAEHAARGAVEAVTKATDAADVAREHAEMAALQARDAALAAENATDHAARNAAEAVAAHNDRHNERLAQIEADVAWMKMTLSTLPTSVVQDTETAARETADQATEAIAEPIVAVVNPLDGDQGALEKTEVPRSLEPTDEKPKRREKPKFRLI